MNFIKTAFHNSRLNYRVSKAVSDAVAEYPAQGSAVVEECIALAEEFPELLLNALSQLMSSSHPSKVLRALELLEQLVQTCSRTFHLSLARHREVQQKLLAIAMKRPCDNHDMRAAQRLARLTILEYSRIFVADPNLQHLATLVGLFESRTKRNLLRCLNVQSRHVAFTEPKGTDFVMISPRQPPEPKTIAVGAGGPRGMPYASLQQFFAARIDKLEPPAALQKIPLPQSLTSPQRWTCQVCRLVNSPMALLCSACETPRIFEEDDADEFSAVADCDEAAGKESKAATHSGSDEVVKHCEHKDPYEEVKRRDVPHQRDQSSVRCGVEEAAQKANKQS